MSKELVIPKRIFQVGLLLALVIVAVLVGAPLLKSSTGSTDADPAASTASVASAGTPGSSPADAQQAIDTEAALETAGRAVREVMWFDYTEGEEAWAERVKPLCTDAGWAFWNMVGAQSWPTMMKQEHITNDIEILSTDLIGEGPTPGSVIVEVVTKTTVVLGGDEPIQEEIVNRVVMVYQGRQWLMDAPPRGES